MNNFHTEGSLVYNLKQDGWKKGNQRMINDFWVSISGRSKEENKILAEIISSALNDEKIMSILQQQLSAEANASTLPEGNVR